MKHQNACLLLALCSGSALAQPFSEAANSPTGYANGDIAPSRECAALAQVQLLDVVSISATAVPAEGEAPSYCLVEGMIAPEVKFQVGLPQTWNSRFYMVGNGGHAGSLPAPASRNQPLSLHFVWAATDTGHDAAKEPGASFVVS